MTIFRNFDENEDVENTYKKILMNQNYYFSLERLKYYQEKDQYKNIWKVIEKLNNIVDESDTDTDIEQIYHAYQTSETIYANYFINNKFNKKLTIRSLFTYKEWNNLPHFVLEHFNKKKYVYNLYNIEDWDWFPLIGLIHDLGKVLLLDDFGKREQWEVVGDTFIVGCQLDRNFVYYDKNYHHFNRDYNNPKFNNIFGIYKPFIGFNQVVMSWGHDEYLYRILKEKNKTKLPEEALYIIRFHSFYCWHTPNKKRGYTHLASSYDWKMLPLLKMFQRSDLYSKNDNIPEINQIKKKYQPLVAKYMSELIKF